MPTTSNTCQHCNQPVRWGQTEGGYKGFVHEDSGLAACADRSPAAR